MKLKLPFSLRLLGLMIILFWSSPGASQVQPFRHFTAEDGLPSSSAYLCYQDSKGYIWVATANGLSRFDGYSFKTFTVQQGLADHDIFSLFEDSSQRLWVFSYTTDALFYIQDDSVHSIPISLPLPAQAPLKCLEDQNQCLWFNTRKGFIRLPANSSEPQLIRHISELGAPLPPDDNKLKTFLFNNDEKGRLWFAKDKLYVLSPDGAWETFPLVKEGSPYQSFFAEGNRISYANTKSVFEFDRVSGTTKHFDLAKIIGHEVTIRRILNDRHFKRYWLYTDQGLFILDRNWQLVKGKNQFQSMAVSSIMEDHEGGLWITTLDNGLYFFPDQKGAIRVFESGNSIEDNHCLSMAVTDSLIFYGSINGKVNAIDRKTSRPQNFLALQGLFILDVVPLAHNRIAILTNRGLGIFTLDELATAPQLNSTALLSANDFREHRFQSSWNLDPNENFLRIGSIKSCNPINDSTLLVATSWGVYKVSFGPEFIHTSRIYDQRSKAVARSNSGSYWIGSANQLLFGNQDTLFPISNFTGPASKAILCLKEDASGTLWIGTNGFGLFTYRRDSKQITAIEETAHTIVKDLVVGPEGKVWVATNQGLLVLDSKGPMGINMVRKVTVFDGLPSNEINQVEVSGKDIFLASGKGPVQLHLSQLSPNTTPPSVRIEEVKTDGKRANFQETIQLNYNEGGISIGFVGFSYKSAGDIRYKFKLEGVDEDWQITRARQVLYPHLNPGNYRFQVVAINAQGITSRFPASINIEVAPPFWQLWWVQALAFLVILASIAALIHWRIGRIKQREKKKAAIQKRNSELELKALRAQLNPHFISNSLNAIQHYILDKDEATANAYLTRFSRLMRMFLDASRSRKISLADELELLKIYTSLEQLRFEGQFTTSWEIDPRLNLREAFIPSFLLQPVIENAIIHGLARKPSPGTLRILIRKTSWGLDCIVEDNGIGREASQKFSRRRPRSSRGLEITRERLKMLESLEGEQVSVQTLDLMNETGTPSGTRVIINVRQMENLDTFHEPASQTA